MRVIISQALKYVFLAVHHSSTGSGVGQDCGSLRESIIGPAGWQLAVPAKGMWLGKPLISKSLLSKVL